MVHPNDITCRKGGNLEMDPIIKINQGIGSQLEYFLKMSSGNALGQLFWNFHMVIKDTCFGG